MYRPISEEDREGLTALLERHDFYSHAAHQRLAQIEAMRAQALADLATSKANSDYESAATSVQTNRGADDIAPRRRLRWRLSLLNRRDCA
jgi:hypothetical protein